MLSKLDTHYGFGLKTLILNNNTAKQRKLNDFHCFSLILIKNHKHSWFFNQNYSEYPTLGASFSKPRQYFLVICFLLKSFRSETLIFGVFSRFFLRIASVDSKHYQTVDISWFWRQKMFNSQASIFKIKFLRAPKKNCHKNSRKKSTFAEKLKYAIISKMVDGARR